MNRKQLQEPIAIVGASCRFPGNVTGLDSFWSILKDGKDAVTSLPTGRCSLEHYFSAAPGFDGHSYTTAAGVIDHIKEFDPDFFGISRKEAMHMDPQQRIVLEATWEALEHAQILPSSLRGSNAGVFMGASNVDMTMQSSDDPAITSPYSMTGSTLSIIANRVSYIHDLHGPSLTIDTACSSSLVAIHMACESLRQGEVPIAIAGGVNVLLAPYPFIGFSSARMLSTDGRCKPFDADGNGYVRSEGVGVLILKPLSQAQKDKDNILGVIAASAVNSDGSTTGIALPSEKAQIAILESTYANFGLDKKNLAYVEAHGTGTAAGDPIEANAIGIALGRVLRPLRPLHIGSAKSNIGHLESAAGMAGIIKALLVLKHKQIPANLHFKTPNPAIDFAGLNLIVPTELTPLPDTASDPLISINSFGFGGTNAHVVLRQAPVHNKAHSTKKAAHTRQTQEALPPFFLSARSEKSLCQLAEAHASNLEHADVITCADTAATLALHRDHLRFRTAITAPDRDALVRSLKKVATLQTKKNKMVESVAENCPGIFVFSGNGSQWPGMGKELLGKNSDFTQAITKVDSLISGLQEWSILDVLRNPEKYENAFSYTEKSQPLLFAIQVGIVEALRAKGIVPQAVIGHSVGEVAAAWACGALAIEDAVTVIHFRSLLQAPFRNTGHMAVANIGEKEAEALLLPFGDLVAIAAVNSSKSLTLAGEEKALREVIVLCKKQRISAKLIDLPYPFHTRFTEGIRQDLLTALSDIHPQESRIPFLSTVKGHAASSPLDGEYWWQNVRRQVVFHDTMNQALQNGFRLFMEVGPNPILGSYMTDSIRHAGIRAKALHTLKRNSDTAEHFDEVWKNAWENGWKIQAKTFFSQPFTQRKLPNYPWNREFLWPPVTPESQQVLKTSPLHPLLGWPSPGTNAVFKNTLNIADHSWLADHVAGASNLFPAAGFIEIMLAAANAMYPRGQQELERIAIHRPLHLSPATASNLYVFVDAEDGGLRLESRPYMSEEPRSVIAKCRISPLADTPPPSGWPMNQIEQPECFGTEISSDALYATTERFSLHYGPAFRTIEKAWISHSRNYPEVLAKISDQDPRASTGMLISPTSLDGAFHTLFLLLSTFKGMSHKYAYLPAAFGRVILFASGKPSFAHSRLIRISPRSVVASFDLLDEQGKILLRLEDCRFRRAAWLEEEKTRPQPYVMTLVPSPHPDSTAPTPINNLQTLAGAAQRVLASHNTTATGQTADQQSIPTRMLLRLAAISSARETVQALCDRFGSSNNFTCQDLLDSGALSPLQEPWLRHMLEAIVRSGMAQQINGGWKLNQAIAKNQPSAMALWRTIVGNAPGYVAEATLLGRITRQAKSILQGDYDRVDDSKPQTVIPPSLVKSYFGTSPTFAPFIRSLETCLSSMLEARKPGQVINILQLAKDPQRLLSHMLPFIAGEHCRYVVAERDAAEAESLAITFGNKPEIHPVGMNLDEPQPAAGYHLIIAAWSMHEQENSVLAIANCLSMLAPGGVLCLLEHEPDTFADFVFGSNPAWWEASADKNKPVSRFQRRKVWMQYLRDAGFAETLEMNAGDSAPAFLLLARKAFTDEEITTTAGPLAAKSADSQSPAQKDHNHEDNPARWVILAGDKKTPGAELAAQLCEAMSAHAITPQIIHAENSFFHEETAHLGKLFDKAAGEADLELINLMGYDTKSTVSVDTLDIIQRTGINSTTALAQAWDIKRSDTRLWLITGGALATDNQPGSVPSQGALWGFGRVLMNEMHGLNTKLCDLHGETPDLESLVQEFLHPTDEQELIFKDGLRLAPRLAPLPIISKSDPHTQTAKQSSGATLTFNAPGRLHNLYWQETPLPVVSGDEDICVAVKAVGLNFRDVMWSMGMLLDEALEDGFSGPGMGIECAGVVISGDKAGQWVAGDEVICFAPSCFSTHVVTNSKAVTRKPKSMSFAQAATIPVAFMTAWYSLKHLAAMQPGERLLVHGAAGGVGLAAVQIAAHLGLEVYATAGSAEKHDFLRQLGVKHIFSSRSLAFASQIMETTKGEGVDAVLNSLAGEAIPASISVLRPFGRFLELGKRDFYADSPLRLHPFRNNITFYGVDLDQMLLHRPTLTQNIFSELMELFAAGSLRPLPHTCFPRALTVEAFQSMQQSSHIGKIVVSLDMLNNVRPHNDVRPTEKTKSKIHLRPDASYLITGGTDGFGLATAVRLTKCGAQHLILLSRGGIKEEAAKRQVAELQDSGINIIVLKADLADAKKLHGILQKTLKQLTTQAPLRGVIHAAAALDDGVIAKLSPERIQKSLAAKSLGAWNLHIETLGCPLDFFVLYSSATTAFGNPGQSSYVAANSMLESLATWRKSQQLPAQVIGWGPIGDTGMLQRNLKAQEMLTSILGITSLSSHEALDWLEHCIATNQSSSHFFGLDWQRRANLAALKSTRFQLLRARRTSSSTDTPILERIQGATAEEAVTIITDLVREEIAAILSLPADRLAIDAPIVAQGMDSLMAVELSIALDQKFSLNGYSIALSEKTTATVLAQTLYAVISGKQAPGDVSDKTQNQEHDSQEQLLADIEHKHAMKLSDTQRIAAMGKLKGDVNE